MWGITNCAVREWRKGTGLQPGTVNAAQQVHDHNTSPTVSASRKKQKTSQSVASLSTGAPSPAVHPSMQPPSSAFKQGPPSGAKSKKPKSVSLLVLEYQVNSMVTVSHSQVKGKKQKTLICASLMMSIQFPSTGLASRSQLTNQGGPAEAASYDPKIGRKVWTRWPADNHFYEAVISDYNPAEVCLQYTVKSRGTHRPLLIFLYKYFVGTTCFGL